MMHMRWLGVAGPLGLLGLLIGRNAVAEVRAVVEHSTDGSGFVFPTVPPPARDDAATGAEFRLLDGDRDSNGGTLDVLHDGKLPTDEDQPGQNFFFRAGTAGGRIRVDLGSVRSVKKVNTYSWHANTRGPQVYRLYGADAAAAGLMTEPARGVDPASCGWQFVARVDTRPADGNFGGQYGVAVTDPAAGRLGRYRYLLFDLEPTEDRDAFGNTFYSEIDVLDADAPPPTAVDTGGRERVVRTFAAEGGRYRFTLDVTAAPDLLAWAESKLQPVVQEWYPKLVGLLPSPGFQAATNITLRFRDDLGGTPASAGGSRVNLNSDWFRRELEGEALGSVVHELVHVVQDYGRVRRSTRATRTPGWLVEGIADYIRWFLFEPEKHGAEITARNLAQARYDASYRITGNFLNWVTQKYDPEIVGKLNAAAREGRYAESMWRERTGKELKELGEEWREAQSPRLKAHEKP
jgi:hypothetical protein